MEVISKAEAIRLRQTGLRFHEADAFERLAGEGGNRGSPVGRLGYRANLWKSIRSPKETIA